MENKVEQINNSQKKNIQKSPWLWIGITAGIFFLISLCLCSNYLVALLFTDDDDYLPYDYEFECGDWITDENLNMYDTIKIGEQCWMAENVNVGEKMNIDENKDNNNCNNIKKFCYDDDEYNCERYGGLYQWNNASCDNICLEGWVLPTDEDWKKLEIQIGMEEENARQIGMRGDISYKLKHDIFWDGDNSSSFYALPGGWLNENKNFVNKDMFTAFWTQTEYNDDDAWVRSFSSYEDSISRLNLNKDVGLSIRCILEEDSVEDIDTAEATIDEETMEQEEIKVCEKDYLNQIVNSQKNNFEKKQGKKFRGELIELDCDLELIIDWGPEKYYYAGEFVGGEFDGYSRIVSIKYYAGGLYTPPPSLIYATKDFENYVLHGSGNIQNHEFIENLNKEKISKMTILPTEHPEEILLDNNFVLSFSHVEIPYSYDSKKCIPLDYNHEYINLCTFRNKENVMNKSEYIIGTTKTYSEDSGGLIAIYNLTTKENLALYNTQKAIHDMEMLKWEKDKDNTPHPGYLTKPFLGFLKDKIKKTSSFDTYEEYQIAIPYACVFSMENTVVNIEDRDVIQVGTIYNLPLYKLKDSNHELNRLAYNNKVEGYLENPEWFYPNDRVKEIPSFEEYINKTPLLFIKDHWGRWIAFGEWDVPLQGGCAKPVIYLYPQEDTKINLKFQAPIYLTKQIPKYRDEWNVLASPNGDIVDLLKQKDDCNKIDFSQKGSEYAKSSCEKNVYPYIYWAGDVMSINYPNIQEGWVVEKENLEKFLNNKLFLMGFNQQEKNDFLEYWGPELKSKDSPYYRISFFQTQDVNTMFPLRVTPQPDSILRMFMDYSLLDQKPQDLPKPQKLQKFTREGFALIEWGGLK